MQKTIHRFSKYIRLFCILVLTLALGLSAALPAYAQETDEEKADRILSEMTLKEKIAQMMVVSMPSDKAASIQSKYQFGGYILFARDFEKRNKKSFKRLIKSCQKKSDIKMLIAVDEEGGTVVRASYYRKFRKSQFRSPRQVYRRGGYKAIINDTKAKDKFLKSLYINTNFGPVADVPYKKSNFMYDRAFSTKSSRTVKFIRKSVTQMDKDDMICALKHFPGYGGNGDTHGRIIRDKRSIKKFKRRDLKPFKAGISSGADMIMVSHTIVNAFDRKRPASLSPAVMKYIRKDMKFDGVIITDGLGMKGVTNFAGSQGNAAVKAVRAGNDMICATGDYKKCYNALLKAARDGRISKSRIDSSVKRILLMKIKRGIIK